jgi:manganese transport protein
MVLSHIYRQLASLSSKGSYSPLQVAITATDLAEIIGSATAMYLLFGLPLWIGVLITAVDVLIILFFGTHNFRLLEVRPACLKGLLDGLS